MIQDAIVFCVRALTHLFEENLALIAPPPGELGKQWYAAHVMERSGACAWLAVCCGPVMLSILWDQAYQERVLNVEHIIRSTISWMITVSQA